MERAEQWRAGNRHSANYLSRCFASSAIASSLGHPQKRKAKRKKRNKRRRKRESKTRKRTRRTQATTESVAKAQAGRRVGEGGRKVWWKLGQVSLGPLKQNAQIFQRPLEEALSTYF